MSPRRQNKRLTVRHPSSTTDQCLHALEGAKEREMLDWLSPSSDFSKVQNETRDCRLHDTGEWLLQDPRYLAWCRSGGLFWINGVGKSTQGYLRTRTDTHQRAVEKPS
jgi:hypothetical protein